MRGDGGTPRAGDVGRTSDGRHVEGEDGRTHDARHRHGRVNSRSGEFGRGGVAATTTGVPAPVRHGGACQVHQSIRHNSDIVLWLLTNIPVVQHTLRGGGGRAGAGGGGGSRSSGRRASEYFIAYLLRRYICRRDGRSQHAASAGSGGHVSVQHGVFYRERRRAGADTGRPSGGGWGGGVGPYKDVVRGGVRRRRA